MKGHGAAPPCPTDMETAHMILTPQNVSLLMGESGVTEVIRDHWVIERVQV